MWNLRDCYFSILREVGPRSRVWTEKEMLEISAWEFAEVRYSVTTLYPQKWSASAFSFTNLYILMKSLEINDLLTTQTSRCQKKKIIIIKIWEMASFTFLTLKKSFSKLSPAIQPQKCIKCHKISPPPKKMAKICLKIVFLHLSGRSHH